MEDRKQVFLASLSMVKVNYMAILKVCIFSGRGDTKSQALIEKIVGSVT